jgi:purine-nucleoside phosphorylase
VVAAVEDHQRLVASPGDPAQLADGGAGIGDLVEHDAPYRETPAAISRARDAGADCVEVESAALYAYAGARGRDVLCLAHVTNTMAVSGDDFEKGDANGALAAIAMTAAIAQVLHADLGRP